MEGGGSKILSIRGNGLLLSSSDAERPVLWGGPHCFGCSYLGGGGNSRNTKRGQQLAPARCYFPLKMPWNISTYIIATLFSGEKKQVPLVGELVPNTLSHPKVLQNI